MLISALISSGCIGLIFFLIGVISEPQNNWYFLAFIVAFTVTFGITLIFGIPLVKLLKKFNKLNWFSLLLTSFSLGFILNIMLVLLSRPSGQYGDQVGDKILVNNGVITMDGWAYYFYGSCSVGWLSMLAGGIFYGVFKYRSNRQNKST